MLDLFVQKGTGNSEPRLLLVVGLGLSAGLLVES